jgi:hypothetical protein
MTEKRFSSWCLALSIVIAGVLAPGYSYADVLAQSSFDTDADGWLVKDLPFPNPGAPPNVLGTFNPTYHGTGGNPGGDITSTDPSGNSWY